MLEKSNLSNNILSYDTLIATLKQLRAINDSSLATEIERILANNQLPKPPRHNKSQDLTTSYYFVDLTAEQVDRISGLFLDLKCQFVSTTGDTTPLASYYGDLCDKWNELR